MQSEGKKSFRPSMLTVNALSRGVLVLSILSKLIEATLFIPMRVTSALRLLS